MNTLGGQLDPIQTAGQTTGYVQTFPAGSGYTCQYCGQWVSGNLHFCGAYATALQIQALNAKLNLIFATLEQILLRLKDVERQNLRVVPVSEKRELIQREVERIKEERTRPVLGDVPPPLPPPVICESGDKQTAWGQIAPALYKLDAGEQGQSNPVH